MTPTAIARAIAAWPIPEWTLTHDSMRQVWKARARSGRVRLTVEAEDLAELEAAVRELRGQTLVVP